MDDIRELVSYLSKAERGYTKILNKTFQQAGYDLSREQYELLQVLWEEDNVNQQTISRKLEKNKYNVTKLLNT
ncbi:MAG: MarR family transcriptional regulator, partial [Odoribacter sp.]|nr:MarR family transcriptional regulator [Odoribacter sp.]